MEDLLLQAGVDPSVVESLRLGLLGRLLLSAFLGGVIGLERELSSKPAGLRTNLLICVGATLLMEISIGVAEKANLDNLQAGVMFRADPSRIAAQIVSGIGFLGAGTILQSRGTVVGLTTAATIWVVAAIGMAVGARAYVEAMGSTILVVGTLVVLGRVEGFLVRRHFVQRYILMLDLDPELLAFIEAQFNKAGLRATTESVEKGEGYEVHVEVSGPQRLQARVQRELLARPGIRKITLVP